jgi:hypothetical protein
MRLLLFYRMVQSISGDEGDFSLGTWRKSSYLDRVVARLHVDRRHRTGTAIPAQVQAITYVNLPEMPWQTTMMAVAVLR